MIFIGICGASGSGKSTLAHALEGKVRWIRSDSFSEPARSYPLSFPLSLTSFT